MAYDPTPFMSQELNPLAGRQLLGQTLQNVIGTQMARKRMAQEAELARQQREHSASIVDKQLAAQQGMAAESREARGAEGEAQRELERQKMEMAAENQLGQQIARMRAGLSDPNLSAEDRRTLEREIHALELQLGQMRERRIRGAQIRGGQMPSTPPSWGNARGAFDMGAAKAQGGGNGGGQSAGDLIRKGRGGGGGY